MHLPAFWPIAEPYTLSRLSGGINNETSLVTAPDGRFILRIYRSGRSLARIRFELDVLRLLGAQPLSFAVPAVVATHAGDPLARFAEAGGQEALATLTHVITGVTPDWEPPVRPSAAVGRAVGELTAALGRIQPDRPAEGLPRYGDLHLVSPAFPVPRDAPAQLPLPSDQQAVLTRLITDMEEQMPGHYATLAQQVIHGDFVHFNLLMDAGRVTGVLDFELAGYDLRALDLAMGLMASGAKLFGTGKEWAQFEAYLRGAAAHLHLREAEITALPFVMRLRRAATLLDMAGRWKLGNAPDGLLEWGVSGALAMEEWLGANSARLVDLVRNCMA